MLEDLGLLFLRQVLQNLDGVVRIQLADAFRDRLRRQFLENFLAYRVVDFRQRGEVEIRAQQLDEFRAASPDRAPRSDRRCRIRAGRRRASATWRCCGSRSRLRSARRILADRAVRIAQRIFRCRVGGRHFFVEHAGLSGLEICRIALRGLTPCILHRQSAPARRWRRNELAFRPRCCPHSAGRPNSGRWGNSACFALPHSACFLQAARPFMRPIVRAIPTRSAPAGPSLSIRPSIRASARSNIRRPCRSPTRKS